MLRVRGRVVRGRLVVDEPTELPEGSEVALVAESDDAEDWTPEHDAELLRRYRDVQDGNYLTTDEVLAVLRAR